MPCVSAMLLAQTDVPPGAIGTIFLLVVAILVLAVAFSNERTKRKNAQQAEHTRNAQTAASVNQRDSAMYEQHRRMNELATLKLEAEVALLQGQVKARGDDDDRLHAAKEFHELSVEKTKLEIDSLRLHIAEQRKRIDDWGLGGGG